MRYLGAVAGVSEVCLYRAPVPRSIADLSLDSGDVGVAWYTFDRI